MRDQRIHVGEAGRSPRCSGEGENNFRDVKYCSVSTEPESVQRLTTGEVVLAISKRMPALGMSEAEAIEGAEQSDSNKSRAQWSTQTSFLRS